MGPLDPGGRIQRSESNSAHESPVTLDPRHEHWRNDSPVRILIASSPHADTFGYSMPPPGVLRLGGALGANGWDVHLVDLAHELAAGHLGDERVLDENSLSAAADRILGEEPDVVGLSTMGATLPAALVITRMLRERAPRLHLHLGGPGIGEVDERVLERFDWIDLIVRGEGEDTLHEVLQRLDQEQSLEAVTGITWRNAEGRILREADRRPLLDMASVAPYAWDLLPDLARYKEVTGEAEGLVPVDSGRGCSYDCSFCSIGRYWGRRSRTLPVDRLVEEVLALKDMPAARNAYLCHDLFGADRQHALAFCARMTELGAPVPWECRARSDHMDAELLQAMGAAGGYRVLLGVESAAPEVRATNAKNMAADTDVLELVDHCAAAGVTPILSFILGLPGEGDEELAASLDLCADASLRTGVNLSLHLANPQPNCALGEDYNPDAVALEGIAPDMAWGAGESEPERELIRAHPDLFSTWHLLALPEDKLRDFSRIAKKLPKVLERYPRTFCLLRRVRGENALELWRAWDANGRSFEGLARMARHTLVDESLAWEQALISRAPTVLNTEHDLSQLTAALRDGVDLPAGGGAYHFATTPIEGPLPAMRTSRVSQDVAQLLGELKGETSFDSLTRTRPELVQAAKQLSEAGLLTLASST